MTNSGKPNHWQFKFLGGCDLQGPDGPIRLESAKTRALLIYLALSPGPHQRHQLMGLLWGDLPETNARRNLRHALWNLRRQLATDASPPPIITEGDTVALDLPAGVWLDTAVFETVCARLYPGNQETGGEALDLESLRTAVDLYRGEFLAGFHVNKAPAFEEWVWTQRERLRTLAVLALERLVNGLTAVSATESALLYAQKLLSLDPLREEIRRQLMRLFVKTDQRAAALAQYQACRQLLADELGASPSPETEKLYRQIKENSLMNRPLHLPVPATAFIGRETEMAAAQTRLQDPNCRLLTLLGPGGIGKTRLALAAAKQAAHFFDDGVFFVPLAAVNTAVHILPALANTLNVPVGPQSDLKTQLIAFLQKKRLLLVLDNFEHLLSGNILAAELIGTSSDLQLLITSRQRLNIQAEWVLEVPGLPSPESVDDPQFETYPAVRLFLQTARRSLPGLALAANERPLLMKLCRLVAGMPLALELAAAWRRSLSLAEIITEIERDLDFLTTEWADMPERHTSLRAAFQHSWRLLVEPEQQALKRLSLFQGGFSTEAAQAVTAVSQRMLLQLVDHSLMQRGADGRFQPHPLIQHYAAEKISEIDKRVIFEKHGRFFTNLVAEAEPLFLGEQLAEAVQCITADIANIRAAWDWAVNTQQNEPIKNALVGMFYLYDTVGWFEEGVTAFDQAVQAFGQSAETTFLGQLEVRQAVLCRRLGTFAQARQLLHNALARFRQSGAAAEMAYAFNQLGNLGDVTGDFTQAEKDYGEALHHWEKLGDQKGVARALNNLGLAAYRQGRLADSVRFYERSLAIKEALGYAWGTAVTLDNLANTLLAQNQLDAAEAHFRQALALAQTLQAAALSLEILTGLAELANRRGMPEQSLQMAQTLLVQPALAGETKSRLERLLVDLKAKIDEHRFFEISGQSDGTAFDTMLDSFLT